MSSFGHIQFSWFVWNFVEGGFKSEIEEGFLEVLPYHISCLIFVVDVLLFMIFLCTRSVWLGILKVEVLDILLWFDSIRKYFFSIFPLEGFWPGLEPISCVHYFSCDLHVYVLVIVWWNNITNINKRPTHFIKKI